MEPDSLLSVAVPAAQYFSTLHEFIMMYAPVQDKVNTDPKQDAPQSVFSLFVWSGDKGQSSNGSHHSRL